MKTWQKIKNEYFSFTRGQQNGLWVLIIFLFAVFVAPVFFKAESENNQTYNDSISNAFSNFVETSNAGRDEINRISLPELTFFDPNHLDELGWQNLGLSQKQAASVVKYIQKYGPLKKAEDLKKIFVIHDSVYQKILPFVAIPEEQKDNSKRPMFVFDPNKAAGDELSKLGFSPSQVKAILNYREKGGKYKSVSDLKKLYGFTNEQYEQIAPYVQVEKDSLIQPARFEMLEINTSDSSQLEALPGIGPALAVKIVNYRQFLGGFVSKEQLLEISGLSPVLLASFQNRIIIDTAKIVKIKLNSAELKELNRHPYLKYDECKAILTYRRLMKQIKNTDELLKNKLVSPENYRRLKPYIEL